MYERIGRLERTAFGLASDGTRPRLSERRIAERNERLGVAKSLGERAPRPTRSKSVPSALRASIDRGDHERAQARPKSILVDADVNARHLIGQGAGQSARSGSHCRG
jgi:hypothetical protein